MRGRHALPIAFLFLLVQLVLLGQLLWSGGLPKGIDLNASLVAGYEAQDNSWDQLWDDSRSPGSPKHISRLTSTELALTWLTDLTGNIELSTRLLTWLVRSAAPLMMYAFVATVTKSRAAGVAAGLVYIFARGAALNSGLPLAAGYALLPLWMLTLDRTLIRPSPRSALFFGLASAAMFTSTLPAFTYIVLLTGLVYTAAYVATQLAVTPDLAATARQFGRSAAAIGGAAAVASGLCAYFLFALWLSTLPVVDATGGYELEDIAQRLPSFSDAAALQPVGYVLGPTWLDGIIYFLVVLVCLASAVAMNFRVGAFLFLYLSSIFFAFDVNSPVYTFLFDNLPYFSLLRGAGRWIAFGTFSIAFLSGTATMLALGGRTVAAPLIRRRYWAMVMPGAMTVAVGSVVAVGILVVTHAGPAREWYGAYPVAPGLQDGLSYLGGIDDESAFATTPFLATRLTGEPYINAIDFGRTLGPGASGKTAFGGLRIGGLDVNETARSITDSLRTEVTVRDDFAVLPGPAQELFVVPEDFQLLTHLTLDEGGGPPGPIEVRFRDRARDQQVTVRIAPAEETVQLLAGVEQRELVGSVRLEPGIRSMVLDVRKSGSRISVSVTPGSTIDALVRGLGASSVLVASESGVHRMDDTEVVRVRNDQQVTDDAIIRLLDLFRVRYFLVQPHTSGLEATRIAGLADLRPVEQWPGTQLYEIDGSHGERAYLADSYGLYLDRPGSAVPALYEVPPLAEGMLPLFGMGDLPADNQSEMIAGAEFIGVVAPIESLESAATLDEARAAPGHPPLVVIPAIREALTDEIGSPYAIPSSIYVRDSVELWPTSRGYVFEADLQGIGSGDADETVEIVHSALVGNSAAVVRLDPAQGRVSLVEVDHGVSRTLQTVAVRFPESPARVRVGLLDESLTVSVDGVRVLSASVGTGFTGGPLLAKATAPGAVLHNIAFATGREGQDFLSQVVEHGFSIATLAEAGHTPRRDVLNLFPHLAGSSLVLRGVPTASYRLLSRVEAADRGFVSASLATGPGVTELPMSQLTGLEGSPGAWFLSEPFSVDSSVTATLFVATQGSEARVASTLLLEEQEPGDAERLARQLLAARPVQEVPLDRHSATSFSGSVPAGQGQFLVFRDAYNEGWELQSDGTSWEQMRAFGTLAAFQPPAEAENGPINVELKFQPQQTFFWGKLVSLLSLVTVALLAAWWLLIPRWRTKSSTR